MTYKMDNVNQIMDALKELDGRSLGVFQRRYADFMQDLSKNRMNNGKLKNHSITFYCYYKYFSECAI